ncbi:glycosyltransferase family 2 protein [Acetonema longum]|uniref:Beta-1,4-glucosyltransferase n=1 Tax=Acetonema longum DSM 6540 TaxID=1009370 RepID=F7NLY3_9FIRM|nr:glycosyltransferase family 2 protein [Acetonema longum]EGO62909.1 beta-1,4-glucosyltransferase [Acetonema longum DSM 6540]
MSNRLAVLILTYNEAENIADCIATAAFADEIIVIDSGSTDRTVEIARQSRAKCVLQPMTEGFAAQRNFALTQTEAEWVLYLDADERLSEEASREIRNMVECGISSAYTIPRINVLFGQPVRYGAYAPDFSLRLYPRDHICWEGLVHEKAITDLAVKKLRGHMFHYTYRSWDRYFFKFNQYTSLLAEQKHQQGNKAYITDILFRPLFAFLRSYILKSGWRDGMAGFIFAMLRFFSTMIKYAKLYFLQKKGFR